MNSTLSPRQRAKSILFGTVALLISTSAILMALELSVRGLVPRETQYDWLQWHPTRLYINNPNLPDVYWDTEWNVNSLGFRGPLPGAKTNKRVLCLGSSTTFGYKVDSHQSYPARLDAALKTYDVINAGTFGYSSYQGKVVFAEEVDRLKPDVVTLAFGYNDRRYVTQPQWRDNAENFTRLYHRYSWHGFWMNSRVYQWLTQKTLQRRPQAKPPVVSLMPRVDTAAFRRNIEAVMQACQKRDIRLLLIFFGEHPALYHAVEQGVDAMRRGQFDEAHRWFDQAKKGASEDARVLAAYYQTIVYLAQGRETEADAINTDYPYAYYFPGVNPIRTYHGYLQVIASLAEKYQAPMLYYRDLIDHDPRYYMDEVHPTAEGYDILAQALAQTLAADTHAAN